MGLVSGACFSEMGVDVTCVDTDSAKIDSLKKGIMPIYEPGLDSLVKKNAEAGRLHFTTDLRECLDDVEVVFSAVGTPADEDGSADLKYVLEVAKAFGRNIRKFTILVTKSTVPVGTAAMVRAVIESELEKRGEKIEFDVASNPEFLKEGAAIKDFMSPDRVVVGVDSERAKDVMARLYRPFLINNFRVIFMDIPSAEMTKYAANAMLATRISFMNDIANLCDLLGANVDMVRKGIGTDSRIGNKFLYPGCGYGGSCFPKDVKALIKTASQHGYRMRVVSAVEEVNEDQKKILFRKFKDYFHGDIAGKKVAVWGLSFKPETDDMREAPSLSLIGSLLEAGPVFHGQHGRSRSYRHGHQQHIARDLHRLAAPAQPFAFGPHRLANHQQRQHHREYNTFHHDHRTINLGININSPTTTDMMATMSTAPAARSLACLMASS